MNTAQNNLIEEVKELNKEEEEKKTCSFVSESLNESTSDGKYAFGEQSQPAVVTECTWTTEECNGILKKDPMHTLARYRLAQNIIDDDGDLDNAERLLEVVQKTDASLNKYGVQVLLGEIKFSAKKRLYPEALNHFAQASEIDPYSVEVMIKMGLCYEKMREFDDAIRCYKKGLRRDKTSFSAMYHLGAVQVRNNQG